MKVIYWADLFGDLEEESGILQKEMNDLKIKWDLWEIANFPQCLDKKFDVLLFDWGGMSMGNSCMESYCKNILDHAVEHPSRIYIMVSNMTAQAMIDAMMNYGKEIKSLSNVFLSIKSAAKLINS